MIPREPSQVSPPATRSASELARAAYRQLKSPVRKLRARHDHYQARRALARAVAESDYSTEDLARLPRYLEHAFGVRHPDYPHALQRPYRYFPGLTAHPVWDPTDFDFVARLLEQREVIRGELAAYREHRRLATHHQGLNRSGDWSVCYLFAAGEQSDDSRNFFPETTRTLAGIPGMGIVGQAYFSVLSPGTHIPAHCGPTNVRLRLQLGVEVPPGCRMRIGEHIHDWDDGHEVLVFDDSFEHEVWIRSESERIVLILDFWHPDLSPAECWALTHIDAWMPDRRRYKNGVRSKKT